ncbi:nitrite reductase small subunit NirD [Streptomyces sp. SB3404]|uniref:Nitrite reductase small subunit NirD n=1 Tax=Streptomyces boncukensis TaxID=2711219 RepID=A0A6G4XB40_9ACTN|nr:nitrite reductase small subunit NirD [Streptomyces boncukensis]
MPRGGSGWTPVCALSDLPPEQGRAALLPDGTAVALFRRYDGTLHALGNLDPVHGAPVMCHGIVGDRGGVPVVTSPLGKEAFALETGRCLDGPEEARLPVHAVRITEGDVIEVSPAGNAAETRVGSP